LCKRARVANFLPFVKSWYATGSPEGNPPVRSGRPHPDVSGQAYFPACCAFEQVAPPLSAFGGATPVPIN